MEVSNIASFFHNGQAVEVEEDVLDIVRQLKAIDPRIHVYYNEQSNEFDLVEDCIDGVQRLIFSVEQLDMRVVRRILGADHWRGRQDPEHVLPDEQDFAAAIESDNEALQREIDERHRDQLRAVGEQLAWAGEQDGKGMQAQIHVKKDLDAPHDG
jgi:hypothetical protein